MQPSQSRIGQYWPAVLGLFSIFSLAGLITLARLPADPEKALALGFSAGRLVLMAALLALALTWAGLALAVWRRPGSAAWFDLTHHPVLWDVVLLAAPLVALAAQALLAVMWALSQHGQEFRYVAYAQRLQPVLDVLTLTGLLLFSWLVLLRRADLAPARPLVTAILWRTAIIWLVFGGLAAFVAATRIGVTPEQTGSWGKPAVPFLEWQVALAWLLGSALLLAEARTPAFFLRKHVDSFIGLVLWLGITILWLSQPVVPAYFATPPRPPNYEIYPFSDGLTYAQYAQSILIGNGFMDGDIPARPLYVVFLAILHTLAGQDYSRVIALQTLVLAAFPLSLYLLGKELGSRPLGLATALLVTLRDLTSNQAAPFTNNLTYSKLYFSELPAALLLTLFAWQAVRWIRHDTAPNGAARLAPLLAGGFLGLSMLVRTQCAIAVLAVLPACAAWLAAKKYPLALRGSLLLLAGIVLAVSPWLWRNWRLTGGLVFDNPASQTMVLAQRYNGVDFEDVIPYLPGETDSHYSGRMLQIALDGVRRDPGQALRTLANHFVNNEIDNVLLFPLRSDLLNLAELWQPVRSFWQEWNGQPSPGQTGLLAAYLALLGLGLAACWWKAGWAGLLPLGINLFYNLWTALFRSSGDRFLVPADWTITFYFAAGLVTLSAALLLLLSRTRQGIINYFTEPRRGGSENWIPSIESLTRPSPALDTPLPLPDCGGGSENCVPSIESLTRPSPALDTPPPPPDCGGGSENRIYSVEDSTKPSPPLDTPPPPPGRMAWSGHWFNGIKGTNRPSHTWLRWILAGLAIFALGCSLPLSEHVFPQRYPPASPQTILAHLAASNSLDAGSIQSMAQQPGALVLRGRAVYPRYYAAGEGEPLSAKTGYSDRTQPRLVFFLLGQTNSLVILDLPQSPPFFPNTADVTLIGLPGKGYIQAEAVLVETSQKSMLYFSDGN